MGTVPVDLVVDLAKAVRAGELTVEEADEAIAAYCAEQDADEMAGHPT